MIKFFRKIRQKLLSENKFSKYLFYALGEIVLVVIGILIALQINNWNEGRKETLRFTSELNELKASLLAYNDAIDSRKVTLESANAYGQYLQDFVNDELELVDTLKLRKAIYYTGYLIVLEKSNAAYQNLINEGDIELIKNGQLKRALALFYNNNSWLMYYHNNIILESYSEYLSYIHKFAAPGSIKSFYQAEINNLFVDPALKGKFIEDLDAPLGTLIDWNELKKDKPFKALIDKVQTNRHLQIRHYTTDSKSDISKIVTLIDEELQNL